MSKTCSTCGSSFDVSGELGPTVTYPTVEDADDPCPTCKEKAKPVIRKRRRVVRTCDPVPTGIHPFGCSCNVCQPCTQVKTTKVVFVDKETCLTKPSCDENGLECFEGFKTSIPKPATQCYPFTKDSFARINRTFGFPKRGGTSRTEILNVVLAEGQPITHDEYGTLIAHPKLNEFGIYDLENPELANNGLDVVGKPVPCGKEFYFGYPQCECLVDDLETLECNSLIENFIIPAIDATGEAVVRSYVGINIGDKVIIRNQVDPNMLYTYAVSGATGSNTLILENEGLGGVPGTELIAASDVAGEFAWCVEPFDDQSFCAQAADTTCILHLLGCDEDGNLRKIRADIDNQAPVYDSSCGGYTNKVIPKSVTCVLLDICFQVAPVVDICNRTAITIKTLDDQKLLDEAAAVLLTDNANPLIEICGYVFSLDLENSAVGALVVTPDFNPTEIVSFDTNCKVCIPEDCCFQCNPQVKYPVETYFPPGLNQALTAIIPSTIITGFGEYKLSVAKRPDNQANILLVHNNATNLVTAAYAADGTPIVLGTLPGDPNDYTYNSFDYCQNGSTCPVDAQYEEDINLRLYDLVLGEQISVNYHTQFDVFQCNEVGSEGEQLTSTQYGIMGHFVGPSKTSSIAFGNEIFGQVTPEPDGFKTYDAISNYKKRTFVLFYPTCVRVKTKVTLLMLVEDIWNPVSESWVYASSTTITVPTGAADRYSIGEKVRFIGETGTILQSSISAVADTQLTIADAVVPNEILYDKFTQLFPRTKIVQMETTSMFRTQNI